MNSSKCLLLICATLLWVGLVGCDRSEPVTFLAAASTVDAAEEIIAASGMEVRLVSAGSNQLAAQIVAGAPAEVLLSADRSWTEFLASQAIETTPLLSNRLCIVTKEERPFDSVEALANIETLALAGPEVPAGRYASEVLAALRDGPRKVVRGSHVRAALAWVARGEADAGIVYTTDARSTDAVRVALVIPSDRHSPIVYPAVRLSGRAEAVRFFQFLQGAEAREIFEKYGFQTIVAE